MAVLKAGTRMRSAVCTTEVIVVKAPPREVTISCGGVPMLGSDEARSEPAEPLPSADDPTLLGKRYVNAEDDLEVLCTKAGDGWLEVDGRRLVIKDAKPLPSSD